MSASEWLRPPVASATGSGCGVEPGDERGHGASARCAGSRRARRRARRAPELDAPVPSWPPELAPQLLSSPDEVTAKQW